MNESARALILADASFEAVLKLLKKVSTRMSDTIISIV